jgi:uncharacterized membrane protein
VAVIGPVILGAIAFLRTTRYAKVIVALDERVKSLESMLKDGVLVREERVLVREEVRPHLPGETAPAALDTPPLQLPPSAAPAPVQEPAPQNAPQPANDASPTAPPKTPDRQEGAAATAAAAALHQTPDAQEPAETPASAGFNWVYALMGGAIATAIVIGVGMAAGSGALGASAQSLGGLVLAAGLIYAALSMPRLPLGQPDPRAALLGAAGVFCGLASAAAGHFVVEALSPAAGLAAWGAGSLACLGLGLVFGPAFAWVGLLAGAIGPAVFRVPLEQAGLDSAYLLTVIAAAMALARLGGWRVLSWTAAAAGLAWGGGLFALHGPGGTFAAAMYLVGLAVTAAALAWDEGAGPAPLLGPGARRPDPYGAVAGWSETFAAGHALAIGAAGLLLALFAAAGPADSLPAAAAIVAVAVLAIAVAVVREGLALFALTAGACAVVALIFWPPSGSLNQSSYAWVAAACLGLFATLGGWAMMLRHQAPTTGAIIAAVGPVAVLAAARLRLGDFGIPWAYGLTALALSAAMAFAFWKLREANPTEQRFAPASAFAVGSALSAALAVGTALPGLWLWLAAGLATLAPLGALADRRFDLAGARAAIGGLAALVVGFLTVGLAPTYSGLSTTPIANELVIVYVIAVVALYAAATIIGRSRGETTLPEGLRMGCVALVAAFLAFTVRHLIHAGDMRAAYASAVELGLHAAIPAAIAFAISFRYGPKPDRPMLRWTERGALGLALVTAAGLILAINPAWGMWARPAAFGLELAYGAPALALGAYAGLRLRQDNPERAAIAGWAAAALGLVWLTMAVRAGADGPDLAGQPISLGAHWGLSLGWVAYAAALGATAVLTQIPGFKQASAALFVAALVKVFVIDLSPLDGVMRAFATLALGALAVAAALAYQRFVFGRAAAALPRRRIDPNWTPPQR